MAVSGRLFPGQRSTLVYDPAQEVEMARSARVLRVDVVVPLSMLERDRRRDDERAERIALLQPLRRPFKNIPSAELDREAADAVTAIRAARRRKRLSRR